MNDIELKRLSTPLVTGNPKAASVSAQAKEQPAVSFQDILRQRIAESGGPNFSRHAVNRAVERNIDITGSNMERLNEGVRLAEEKGLQEPLILVGGTAFIVSVKNNTVITTVEGSELKGSVFTNIDGTVII